MREPCVIITNNPLIKSEFGDRYTIKFINCTALDIMRVVRDEIHKGYKLLTHPLISGIKPNEIPYRTIAISKTKGQLDYESLCIIEDSINTTMKFINMNKTIEWSHEIMKDFQVIDMDIMKNALYL